MRRPPGAIYQYAANLGLDVRGRGPRFEPDTETSNRIAWMWQVCVILPACQESRTPRGYSPHTEASAVRDHVFFVEEWDDDSED